MRSRLFALPAAALLTASAAAGASPSERIVDTVGTALSAAKANWPPREAAASAAAERFLRGGSLWVAGSIPRFDIEWLNRAGGIMPVAVMKSPDNLGENDVLVYGCMPGAETADAALLAKARERKALVIAFGAAAHAAVLKPVVDNYLAVDIPTDTPMAAQVTASACLAQLWAFSADLVGACTRAGKMPTMWQSVMVPGARDRNARYRPLRFHEDLVVPAQAPGTLGNRYLDTITQEVGDLRKETSKFQAAGKAIRAAVRAGHKVFHANLGHYEPALLLPKTFPVTLTVLGTKAPETELREKAAAGDVLLCIWYTELPAALLAAAKEKGVTSICCVAGNPPQPHDLRLVDIFVDPHWVYGDAALALPNYDVKILPPSGVLNSLVFNAALAEAQGAEASIPGKTEGAPQ